MGGCADELLSWRPRLGRRRRRRPPSWPPNTRRVVLVMMLCYCWWMPPAAAQTATLDKEDARTSTFPLWQPIVEMRELSTLFATGAVHHDFVQARQSNFSAYDEELRELLYGLVFVQTKVVAW